MNFALFMLIPCIIGFVAILALIIAVIRFLNRH